MKGIYVSKSGCEKRTLELVLPESDEVLIKNVAVDANPKDWKMAAEWGMFEGVEGNDVAGYIEAVGKDVTEFKKGDKVAAFTKIGVDDKFGAYQEYSIAPSSTTFHLGPKSSFEDAATLPLAAMTAAICLFVKLGLPQPCMPDPSQTPDPHGVVVINGAASSVGAFAVQLAKLARFKVIGIAGVSSQVAKDLDADVVIDYRNKSDEELAKDIVEAVKSTSAELVGIVDAVSTKESGTLLAEHILQAFGGGSITTLLPAYGQADAPANVKILMEMVATAYGDDSAFAKRMYRQLGQWLEEGIFKPNKVKLMPNGLDSVEEGLALLRNNKVNGVKLVYRIADTSDL